MEEGLVCMQRPGRAGWRGGIIVGYVRRVRGDEWVLLPGARPVLHTPGRPWMGAPWIAGHGLRDGYYRLREPTVVKEYIHRGLLLGVWEASHEAWDAHVQPPPGWPE